MKGPIEVWRDWVNGPVATSSPPARAEAAADRPTPTTDARIASRLNVVLVVAVLNLLLLASALGWFAWKYHQAVVAIDRATAQAAA